MINGSLPVLVKVKTYLFSVSCLIVPKSCSYLPKVAVVFGLLSTTGAVVAMGSKVAGFAGSIAVAATALLSAATTLPPLSVPVLGSLNCFTASATRATAITASRPIWILSFIGGRFSKRGVFRWANLGHACGGPHGR